jgi:hypothetical protein
MTEKTRYTISPRYVQTHAARPGEWYEMGKTPVGLAEKGVSVSSITEWYEMGKTPVGLAEKGVSVSPITEWSKCSVTEWVADFDNRVDAMLFIRAKSDNEIERTWHDLAQRAASALDMLGGSNVLEDLVPEILRLKENQWNGKT